jgi:hypothetical protein
MCYNVRFSTDSPEYHRFDIDISLMISLLEYLVFKNGSDEFACRLVQALREDIAWLS